MKAQPQSEDPGVSNLQDPMGAQFFEVDPDPEDADEHAHGMSPAEIDAFLNRPVQGGDADRTISDRNRRGSDAA